METDKRYFFEGLFIIALSLAAALVAVWLSNAGHSDDVVYRIHFAESVSGLSLGDPVKFNGVDIGNVKTLQIDPENSRLVKVEVKLRKSAPIKTDTKAVLKLKGITGVVFIEMEGGSANAKMLADATVAGQMPEIPSQKSTLTEMLEQLPIIVRKFSGIEDKVSKVAGDVSGLTGALHDKFLPSDKSKAAPKK
jgi:phospholipid/cholesterol/gamma-HCH transport system substrate-binding protein